MNAIINVIQRISSFSFASTYRNNLGRWKLIEARKQFERQDRSNNDHCGVCHFSDFKKIVPSNTYNEKKNML